MILGRRVLRRGGAPSAGAGGGGGSWQTYPLADVVASNMRTVVTGTPVATGDQGEGIQFTCASGVAATTVPTMAYWEWSLKDLVGGALASVNAGDILRMVVQSLDAVLPVGLRLGVALTDLGLGNTPQQGCAVGLQHHVANTSYYAWQSQLSAGTWLAITTASQPDLLMRSVEGVAVKDAASNRMRICAVPRDAVDYETARTGACILHTGTSQQNADGEFTRIALLVGNSAALGSAATVRACVKSFLRAVELTTGFVRKATPAVVPRFPSAGAYRLLVTGDSYAIAFNAGSALSGLATSTGLAQPWTIRFAGSTITTWPVATVGSPNVGAVGYLLPLFEAWTGNTGGVVVRRGTSGHAMGDPTEAYDTDLAAALLSDCVATSVPAFDVAVVFCGTNDASSGADTARFAAALRRYIRTVRDHSPNAIIYVPVTTPDVGSFPFVAQTEAAKAEVCAEFEHVYHLDCAYASGDAAGHPTDAGQQDIADAINAHLQGLAA